MPRGGKREGAGRKKGAATKRTRKTSRIAEKAAGEGAQPLEVLLIAMRHHYAAERYDEAAKIAAAAAPYVHPRLASVKHDGTVGVQLEVVEEITSADGS